MTAETDRGVARDFRIHVAEAIEGAPDLIAPTSVSMPLDGPQPGSAPSRWQRIVAFVVRRRVAISTLVFLTLILEDVVEGVRPHNLANVHDAKAMLGLGLVLAGLALRSWAAGILRKSTELATCGPYGIIRNPLYVGSFLMMLGICTLIDDEENIWFVVGPIAALYVLKVLQEERTLAERFGEPWRAYVRAVPRFLPFRLPRRVSSPWSVNQWLRNREHHTATAVLLGLVAIQMWHWY